MAVSRNKSRVEVFHYVYNQLNKDPPTYTDRDSNTATYTILSSFPEISPTFPCIVINPIIKRFIQLGVDKRPNTSLPSSFDIDFYAKCRDGKNAIDIARDKVQLILSKNWITEVTTIDTSLGGRILTISGVE